MYNLNIEKTKTIIREVFKEEKKINSLNSTIDVLTVIEFYKDYAGELIKKSNTLKSKLHIAKLPMVASGIHSFNTESKEGNIYIFLKDKKKIEKGDGNLYKILFICYHEIFHAIQTNYDKYSYDGFLYDMDYFLQKQSSTDYHIEHSKYSYEMKANLYGAKKAREYIQKHYPDLYEKEKEKIEKFEQKQKFYYITYDVSDTVERMIVAMKKQLKNNNIKNMDKISPVLEIFLNSDISFKSISEIVTQEKFKTLDKRIVYAFLSSKMFLDNINIEQLTDEELNLLFESLQYTSGVYQNQFKLLEQEKSITLKELLKTEKSLIHKYMLINDYYVRKIKHKLNFRRSDRKKEAHMESIPEYLDRTETQIKKRKISGYLVINCFYIVSTILSILTISYLLISN